ncbi:MAG: DUF4350 domain-containing protein, partial [Candidatus Hydrothermarchaeaceae archaeon]
GETYDLEGEKDLSLQRFSALLMEQGVNVLSLKRGTLDDETLEDVDVLILSYPQVDLDIGEAEAIRRYVANGGGLLVLGGQLPREYVNPLLGQFEMEMGYDLFQRDGSLDVLLLGGTHEVFAFVEEFGYYHAPAVRVADPSWMVYQSPMFGENWALFASREYGAGRVFVSGDADFLNNFFLDAHDNAQLGYNMVLYTGGRPLVKLERRDHFNWAMILLLLAALVLLVFFKNVWM